MRNVDMRALTTILLTLAVLTTLGQERVPKDLGIGFAVATNPYKLEGDSHVYNIYTDKDLKTKFINGTTNQIYPFFYKPDYGLYHFICLAKTADYYKVLINDSTIAYLPNDTNFHFTTWETILLSATVERLTNDNPIKREPFSDSMSITWDCKDDRLKVEKVIKGKDDQYWILVSTSPSCDLPFADNTKIIQGWIMWRTKNKLLG
jgi:hypothetical protein